MAPLGNFRDLGHHHRLDEVRNRLALPTLRFYCHVAQGSPTFAGQGHAGDVLQYPSAPYGIHGVAALSTVGALFFFFLKAGAFVFGSGLAIVPFLYGGVVARFHWLTERQFVDAVAVAMITPGPVVITAGFVGYLVAGALGAIAAAWAVFAPPYFIVLFGAPYYRRFAQNRQVKAFVQGVTAAAVGAIAGAAYILARRSLIDIPTVLIAIVTLTVLMSTKKVPEPIIILLAGVVGVFLHGTTG